MSTPTYFIADLHLDPKHAEAYALALTFLEQLPDASTLYILGDLFEYWIGDDAGVAHYRNVIDALASLRKKHCQTYVMHGNRDFLLGDAFAQSANVTLIRDDERVISLDGSSVLLMHGDTLCTDDKPYQAFRPTVRDPLWQDAFLNKTPQERTAVAEQLRKQSSLNAQQSQTIVDVNEACVQQRMTACSCNILIHGHTHRPALHPYPASTQIPAARQRFVVGDWHAGHAQYVVHDSEGIQLKRFARELCTPAPSF